MAAERSPTTIQTESHTYIEIEIHATLFSLLNADGMEGVKTTTTSHNMAAILQLIGRSSYATLVDSVHI